MNGTVKPRSVCVVDTTGGGLWGDEATVSPCAVVFLATADGGLCVSFFFFQAEDGIRDYRVTGVQTCALPIEGDGIRDYRVTGVQTCALPILRSLPDHLGGPLRA